MGKRQMGKIGKYISPIASPLCRLFPLLSHGHIVANREATFIPSSVRKNHYKARLKVIVLAQQRPGTVFEGRRGWLILIVFVICTTKGG